MLSLLVSASDNKFTSKYLFKLDWNSLKRYSKKQKSVSVLSAEAECISSVTDSQETNWLIMFLEELDLPQSFPINIYEDNQAITKLGESEKYHSYIKHIYIKFHLLNYQCETGKIELNCLPSNDMTAYVLTKPLHKPSFIIHTIHWKDLHLVDIPTHASGGILDSWRHDLMNKNILL